MPVSSAGLHARKLYASTQGSWDNKYVYSRDFKARTDLLELIASHLVLQGPSILSPSFKDISCEDNFN